MSGNSNPEELEETISQYLQDLGMLEDGMTSDDKRNLWAVIKISQDTAKAEEQDRQKRARQALQFNQVSSRTDSSSGSEASPGGFIEEIISSSARKTDRATEEEKKTTLAAVLPQQCTTPSISVATSQRTTATILPLFHSCEGDTSQDQNSVNSGSAPASSCSQSPTFALSQNKHIDSASQHPHSPPRHVAEPSERSCLQLSSSVGTKETRKLSPRNNSSSLNAQNSPVSRLCGKERYEIKTVPEVRDITGSLKSEVSLRNSVMTNSDASKIYRSLRKSVDGCEQDSKSSSPVAIVESSKQSDQDDPESPVSNIQESSLVSRIRHSLSMSNYQKSDIAERISDRSEVSESCCEEKNFSALKEEQNENMCVEKSASVGSADDNVPSPLSDSLLHKPASVTSCNNSRDTEEKVSEDRERNINPFDCDRNNYEWTLKVCKVKRACSRLPFYIPPYKMDVHTYITYFKSCINEQAARLIEVQQRNHKCVPWGEPVVVGEPNSRVLVTVEQGEQKSKRLADIQRYSFQDCTASYQRVNTTYEDPDMQSDDDMFFTDTNRGKVIVESQQDASDDLFDSLLEEKSVDKKEDEGPVQDDSNNSHNNFIAVDRQGSMKRKSDSSDDQIFDQEEKSSEPQEKQAVPNTWLTANKEEVPAVAVKRKKFGQAVSNAESACSCGDLDGDFEPSKKLLRRPSGVKSYVRKKNQKKVSSNQSQSISKGGDMDDMNIHDDLDSAEGVGGDSRSCQEIEIIRPGPVKLRRQGRRLFRQSKEEVKREKTEHKESDAAPMGDIAVVYEVGSSGSTEQESELVPCPICRKTFSPKDIEEHASECNEYCEEEIPPDELHISPASSSPEMVTQNSQGAISEQCWSEFDSGKEFEDVRGSTYQTRQQRPQTHQGTAASKHTSA